MARYILLEFDDGDADEFIHEADLEKGIFLAVPHPTVRKAYNQHAVFPTLRGHYATMHALVETLLDEEKNDG